jgi:hypothetical protein
MYEGRASGRGVLPFDGKVGNIVNGAISTAIMYVAVALNEFDVTPLPDVVEPAIGGFLAMTVGLLLTKVLPRFRSDRPAD